MNLNILILAGGMGTRMKSALPKVMHKICGKPIIKYIVDTSKQLNPHRIILLIGNGSEIIKEYFEKKCPLDIIHYAYQKTQLGTGDAVKAAIEFLENNTNVIILSGDVPLISKNTLEEMLDKHQSENNTITLLTMNLENPHGYGRIVKENDNISNIIEEKDADENTRNIKEVNAGIYCIKTDFLKKYVFELRNDNAQKEYYITDLINIAYKNKMKIKSIIIKNKFEVSGINNRKQLSEIEKVILENKKNELMLNGTTIENPESVYIDYDVIIEKDVIIESNVVIKGNSVIKEGSIIKAGAYIKNYEIKENTIIEPNSVLTK